MPQPVNAVLFDLDGTLLDTAPDLTFALNRVREMHGLEAMSEKVIRSVANLGSKKLLQVAFNADTENQQQFQKLKEQFISFYQQHIADQTVFFPEMESVLVYLENKNIPWGIVTNKITNHTMQLLKELGLENRPQCIVCGDSLIYPKPHPAPILHGCELLKLDPKSCLYVGDASTDVIASKAAGTRSMVALYGYIHEEEDPYSWEADHYISKPIEIIDWLEKHSRLE